MTLPRANSRPTTLADHGEDRVLAELLAELPPVHDPDVIAGAGDDCAILRGIGAGKEQLLKTDCVIEGVHFTPDTAPQWVGWKALCRPLSDIAAMGGEPRHALVTIAMRSDTTLRWAKGVYRGIGRAAREFGVSVVGGETACSPGPVVISVCLTGTIRRRYAATRHGARPGDLLYVTGRLGGSFESGRHLRFRPRLEEAQWLVGFWRVRAMMDLSDGLATDLPRLAKTSGAGFVLEGERVPRARNCTLEQAVGDGEDYELLFAVSRRDGLRLEAAWKEKFPAVRLSRVGVLAEAGMAQGLETLRGYQHFGTS